MGIPSVLALHINKFEEGGNRGGGSLNIRTGLMVAFGESAVVGTECCSMAGREDSR